MPVTLRPRRAPRRPRIGYPENTSQSKTRLVFAGDTLYPMLEIAALTPRRSTGVVTLATTMHNQNGEFVLSGEQKILLRKRAAEISDVR